MQRKVILILTSIIFVSAVIYYFFYRLDIFALDEKAILKETREAYQNIKFERKPFLKKEKIQDLGKFLLRHVNEIKNYNKHEEYRKIQLTEGSFTSHYTNSGDCFNMPTFHKSFIKDYIPPDLIDSLNYYSEGLRDDFLAGFSVCNKNYVENLDKTKASIVFFLNYEKNDLNSGSYYVYHKIIQNKKFKSINTINSIYDYGLAKDTVLLNDLRYTITLIPYSGI